MVKLMMNFPSKFYFVRHGETDWNKNRIYQGQNDIPLNNTGRKQASEVSQKVSRISDIDAVFSSPLLRAKETAEIIYSNLADKIPILIEELMECKSVESASYILQKKGIENLPSFSKIPGGIETPDQFLARVEKAMSKINEQKHQCPLIVAHGGVCTAICLLLDIPLTKTPNCCLLRFEKSGERYSLEVYN